MIKQKKGKEEKYGEERKKEGEERERTTFQSNQSKIVKKYMQARKPLLSLLLFVLQGHIFWKKLTLSTEMALAAASN